MKTKQMLLAVWVALIEVGMGNASPGATNDVSALLQKGLLEEEANHNLEAAIQAYQAVVTQTEKERQFAATAVFRLGECYRKLGRTNEANMQYQRILKEFSDQPELVKLSQSYVRSTTSGPVQPPQAMSPEQQLAIIEAQRAQALDPEGAEIERLKAMIKDSPDLINARTASGDAPLFKATYAGQLRVAAFLVDNKADIEARSSDRHTPLLLAAERGNREMVELLLNRGADATASCRPTSIPADDGGGGITALHFAANFGYRAIAESLLAHGAKVDAKTDSGKTALHTACAKGFKSVAELLLANGTELNATDKDGSTVLMAAVLGGNRAIAEWLISRQADVNHKDNNNWTALHTAVNRGHNELIKLLLENRADPNVLSVSGTPLMLAADLKNSAGTELLLKHGADVNATNSNGKCALRYSIEQNDELGAKLLLDNKADPNIEATDGWSLLPLAVANRRKQIAEELISHGADVNARSKNGLTPLHYAVAGNEKEMVELLVSNKADVNLKDNDGNTPLDLINSSAGMGPRPGRAPSPVPMVAMPPPGAPLAYQWSGQPSQTPQPYDAVALMLREHGAVGELERSTIRVFRKGISAPQVVFRRDSKSLNRYTLLEVIQQVFSSMGGMQFPDFCHISITHGAAVGAATNSPIVVDLLNGTDLFDCAKDRPLEFGDIVEIPEREHALSELWNGLQDPKKQSLWECAAKRIRVVVKGESSVIRIGPGYYLGDAMKHPDVLKVLFSSSDLTRLKVTRTDPVTKKAVDMKMNGRESQRGFEDLWVRDGDVIEVPDKQ